MKNVWKKCMWVTAAAAVAIFGTFGNQAAAAEASVTLQVTTTYGQTEARSMLAMINEFRTGSDAWYWNSTDTEKVECTGLSELSYDYNLEKIAMQRVIEVAINFSHTRPNGSICFTAYTGSYRNYGENIAAGQRTAAEAFSDWQETNETYSGQGHRRNMLSSGYGAVGIGHVYHNGIHYWVQEFGDKVYDGTETKANDEQTLVSVDVAESALADTAVTADVESVTLYLGEEKALPKVTGDMLLSDAWPAKKTAVSFASEWTVEDPEIASIENGTITGKKAGTTLLKTEVLGQTVSVAVEVKKTESSIGKNTGSSTAKNTVSAVSEAVGTKLTDGKTGNYKVTAAGVSGKATVTYLGAVNKKQKTVTIPESVTIGSITYKVTAIAPKAFKNQTSLKKVTIGKNILSIGKQAFSGCKNLKQITVKTTGLTKKSVGSKAFYGISGKVKTKVPGNMRTAYKKILPGI